MSDNEVHPTWEGLFQSEQEYADAADYVRNEARERGVALGEEDAGRVAIASLRGGLSVRKGFTEMVAAVLDVLSYRPDEPSDSRDLKASVEGWVRFNLPPLPVPAVSFQTPSVPPASTYRPEPPRRRRRR